MAFQLEGFEIGESIGSGGFGEVYAARQLGVDRPVAIKVGHLALSDTKDRLRFERECKALGKLSTHPNIATVHTAGTLADGRPYLVLEYVDGGDLLDWATANRATDAEIISIGLDLASAVAEAHRNEIIHRDLKPENLLLRSNGQAVLGDFGIAQMQDGLRTATGTVTASVAYAAPEILGGARATPSADIYGIGICLLVAATGTIPFTEPTDESLRPVLARVLSTPPPSLTAYGHSARLDDLVQRLLAKESAHRPATATAVEAELRQMTAAGAAPTRPMAQSTMARIPVAQPLVDTPPAADQATAQNADATAMVAAPLADRLSGDAPAQPPASLAPPPVPTAPPVPITPAGIPTADTVAPSTGRSPLVWVAAALVLVAIVGIGAVFALRGSDDPQEVVAASESETERPDTEAVDDSAPTTAQKSADAETATTVADSGSETADAAPATDPPQVFDATEPIVISDEISVALDFRTYPIDLVEGQSIAVSVKDLAGTCERSGRLDLYIALLDPAGEEVGREAWPGNYGCASFGGDDWTAATAGVHTLRIRGGDGEVGTGTFEATVETLIRRRESIDISEPVRIEDGLTVPRDTLEFAMELEAGERFSVEIAKINNGCSRSDYWDFDMYMTDPAGELIFEQDVLGDTGSEEIWLGNQGCGAYGFYEATTSGTHALVFRGRDGGIFGNPTTGTVVANVAKATDSVATIDTSGPALLSGEIATARSSNTWLAELTAGDQFSLDVQSVNGDCEERLDFSVLFVGPSGDTFEDETNFPFQKCGVLGPFTTTEDGEHQIIVFGGEGSATISASDATGSYEMLFGKLGG
jgi:hypothetical protein